MKLFRSEDMSLVQISVTRDRAKPMMAELGRTPLIHLVDANDDARAEDSKLFKDLKMRSVNCTAREKTLRELRDAMKRFGVEPQAAPARELKVKDVLVEFSSFINPLVAELKTNMQTLRQLNNQLSQLHECNIVVESCSNDALIDISEEAASVLRPRKRRREGKRRDFDEERGLLMELDEVGDEKRPPSVRIGALESTSDQGVGDSDFDLESMLVGSPRRGRRAFAEARPRGRGGQTAGDDWDKEFYRYICGTVPASQQVMFARTIYRISRGNALLRYIETDREFTDNDGNRVSKSVFTIVTSGKDLPNRIAKVVEFFGARLYRLPSSAVDTTKLTRQINAQIAETEHTARHTTTAIRRALRALAGAPGSNMCPLRDWESALAAEKALSLAMLRCRFTPRLVVIEGWVPSSKLDELRDICAPFNQGESQAVVLERDAAGAKPPTYFELNKITSPFQGIVDTYGVPRYKEINPGLFAIVSFPFIFGVMYGDMGHGGLLFLISVYLIYKERSLQEQQDAGKMNEILAYAFNARYCLIFMGFFGFYCGTIYNDLMSVPLQLFDSAWKDAGGNTTHKQAISPYSPYPYGIDYNWYHTKNELSFFNSLKMKMSVIIGVTQMTFGIVLSGLNHWYAGDRLSLLCEWVPRMLFMLCTFGYMCIIIIYKWTQNYGCTFTGICTIKQPPALIQTMIKMFLSPGSVPKSDELYEGQAAVQLLLILIAVISVPVMLLAKPLILNRKRQGANGGYAPVAGESDDEKSGLIRDLEVNVLDNDDEDMEVGGSDDADDDVDEKRLQTDESGSGGGGHGHGDEDSLSDALIFSGIHTIEFVLGCVSNTASYLRLWALSLAHAELAAVFWDKFIVEYGAEATNPMMLVVTFAVWAAATVLVLMCMDLLECFLHALRLTWVEWMNKFYAADGYKFTPLVTAGKGVKMGA